MLIRNKSPRSYRSRSGYAMSRKGCASIATQRDVEEERREMLLQWLAEGCCGGTRSLALRRGFCSRVAGGTVGYIQAKQGTERQGGKEEGREGRKRRQDPLQNIEKISSRDRGERATSAGAGARRKKAEIKRAKVERDREFGRVRVFLDAVCANVTAFKVEYIARMYPRCTRSGLRLTCVTYSRKLYSNRGTFCARKCGYKLQLYGGRKLHGIHDCNL